MDFYSLFKIIQHHPVYKARPDSFRQWVKDSRRKNENSWDELRSRLRQEEPALLEWLEGRWASYRKCHEQTQTHRRRGFVCLAFGEEAYPAEFYLMGEPPLTLMYWGEPAWRRHAGVAVVGSREVRRESLLWMESELADFLRRCRPQVISGGARGVDQKAHLLAIRQGLPTTVVLPSGLGSLYPASLREWMKPVREAGGCFLSEYDFEQPMQKYLFHHRNRLIAALAKGTLIVEARRRSGTLITAQQSAQNGRPVWVVPGHPGDGNFAGSLDLLSEGAMLVRDAQDLTLVFQAENEVLLSSQAPLEVEENPPH